MSVTTPLKTTVNTSLDNESHYCDQVDFTEIVFNS